MGASPEVQAYIDALSAVFPDMGTTCHDAVEARRIMAAMPDLGLPEVELASVEDRTIPGDIPVRIYTPHGEGSPGPVTVYFHGGGWALCDLDTHDRTVRKLARAADSVVVSVDYRLAPEARFPAAAEDAYAATAWAAEELGPTLLAVAGDSAGGNLAAVVAQMARDRGGPAVDHQLLVYPVIDHACDTDSFRENASGYFLSEINMRWYWEQYLGPDGDGSHPYASPLRAEDLSGLPPATVVTAELDPLRDEGEAYAEALAAAGVPVAVYRAEGMFHGFFNMDELLPPAAPHTTWAQERLREALHDPR
jgi:acetyl esterase